MKTLYHQGLKLALDVRNSTPTALLFLESRQPSIVAMIRKRQLNFWLKLKKENGTELHNLIERASNTCYIRYYKKLEEKYENSYKAFERINNEHYEKIWNEVKYAKDNQTKLKQYHEIYDKCESIPERSLLSKCNNSKMQKRLAKYLMSLHDLETEKGRWTRTPKGRRY